jgi:hypothetical protein
MSTAALASDPPSRRQHRCRFSTRRVENRQHPVETGEIRYPPGSEFPDAFNQGKQRRGAAVTRCHQTHATARPSFLQRYKVSDKYLLSIQ